MQQPLGPVLVLPERRASPRSAGERGSGKRWAKWSGWGFTVKSPICRSAVVPRAVARSCRWLVHTGVLIRCKRNISPLSLSLSLSLSPSLTPSPLLLPFPPWPPSEKSWLLLNLPGLYRLPFLGMGQMTTGEGWAAWPVTEVSLCAVC